jgi:hypothetical protein
MNLIIQGRFEQVSLEDAELGKRPYIFLWWDLGQQNKIKSYHRESWKVESQSVLLYTGRGHDRPTGLWRSLMEGWIRQHFKQKFSRLNLMYEYRPIPTVETEVWIIESSLHYLLTSDTVEIREIAKRLVQSGWTEDSDEGNSSR